jgi:hypothetical protein
LNNGDDDDDAENYTPGHDVVLKRPWQLSRPKAAASSINVIIIIIHYQDTLTMCRRQFLVV